MIVFPNAKINLGLNIVEKRSDGFHNIETCFFPVQWCDIIEISESQKTAFQSTGISIPGDTKDNLCIRAFRLLQEKYSLPEVNIHLHKNIPIGAGLGGGSADAAFVLKAINEKYNLSLDNNTLKSYASTIGSDCSFFIDNKPSIAYGTGNELEEVQINLSDYFIVLIYPALHVDTKTAYSGVKPKKPDYSLKEVITKSPMEEWKNVLKNDFETGIFQKFPEIEHIKTKLYQSGAVYACMSGSGSTVFGVFDKEVNVKNDYPSNYSIQHLTI